MKKILFLMTFIVLYRNTYSQQSPKFGIQINYGVNGNFFVRDYDEIGGPNDKVYLFKKNFIGSVSGINLSYKISPKSSLFLEYSKTINVGKKNYSGIINGVDINIRDFKLKHTNNIYQFGYSHALNKRKTSFKLEFGLMLIYDSKQTIEIENFSDVVRIDESNFKNDRSVEGGMFIGFSASKMVQGNFELGVKTRFYYLISTNSAEAITLMPTLTYNF